MSPCVSEDPERGALGIGPLGAAFAGCLWTWVSGSAGLRGPIGALLWCQQREGPPAERIASGPHGLPLRKVPKASLALWMIVLTRPREWVRVCRPAAPRLS